MSKILGYGEDALTFWALKNHISDILKAFKDHTASGNCLIFFRPSFGRRGGSGTAQFGEFDAILTTSQSVYLIESKWDNFRRCDNGRIDLDEEQKLRHQIFIWYLLHWDAKYSGDWKSFVQDHNNEFQNRFGKKTVGASKMLAKNLEIVLTRINEHFDRLEPENIKNILLFFYNKNIKSSPPTRVTGDFNLVCFDYSQAVEGHFVVLES